MRRRMSDDSAFAYAFDFGRKVRNQLRIIPELRFFNEHKDWRLLIAPHVIAEEHLKLIQIGRAHV